MRNFTFKPFLATKICSIQYVIVAVLFTFIGYSSYGQTHFESGDSWGTAGRNAYTAMIEMPVGSGKYVTHTSIIEFQMERVRIVMVLQERVILH